MPRMIALAVLLALAACTTESETATLPAPDGPWEPANPPSLQAAAPALLSPGVSVKAGVQ